MLQPSRKARAYVGAPCEAPVPQQSFATRQCSFEIVSSLLGIQNRQQESIPVEESAKGTSEQSDGETLRKTKREHAESSTGEAHEKDRLPADLVAEASPQDARRELGKGESRGDHAGVERDFALVLGDAKVPYHVVNVREDGHEGDGLANPAESCQPSESPNEDGEKAFAKPRDGRQHSALTDIPRMKSCLVGNGGSSFPEGMARPIPFLEPRGPRLILKGFWTRPC